MATVLLILSIVFFITTFGIHIIIANGNDQPMYLSTLLAFLPIISGFILPVIPLWYISNYHWLILTVINAILVFGIGPKITKAYIVRLSTGILGKDMMYSFGLGVLTLIIGILILDNPVMD